MEIVLVIAEMYDVVRRVGRQKDTTNLIIVFSNFVNAPNCSARIYTTIYAVLLKIRPCYYLVILTSEYQDILLMYKLQYISVYCSSDNMETRWESARFSSC